jgi:hypothetical protein
MNNIIKRITALLFFIIICLATSRAQEKSFSITPTIGIGALLLEDGLGFHIGLNPHYSLTNHFGIEGQVSFIRTQIKSAFVSGRSGTANTINTLLGARFYFNAPGKKVRPYINLLIGGMYNDEEKEGLDLDPEFGLGLSAGTFVEINEFVLGVSFDTPSHLIFKAGYRF